MNPDIGFDVWSEESYNFGEIIEMPAVPGLVNLAGESIDAYYTFLHWIDDDGNTYAADAVIEMPSKAINFYPVYERVTVKLVPVEGSTAMVDRYVDGASVVESYNDGYTVTTETYTGTKDFERYYVYGFADRMREANLGDYIKVQGDGYYEVEYSELSGRFGTGAKIVVYDNFDTSAPAEVFYVIIFGDVNGDGRVTGNDETELTDELMDPTWSRRDAVPYRCKATNIDGNTRVTVNDLTVIMDVNMGSAYIDQVNGVAVYY